MPGQVVKTASTNSEQGSIANIVLDDIVASIFIAKNQFMDDLPVIPKESRVIKKKVLYRMELHAKLVYHGNGKAAAGKEFLVKSNREVDEFKIKNKSDQDGIVLIILETWEPGDLELESATPGILLPIFKIKLKYAWYESLFLITGYHVCAESDFSGELADGNGLDEKHKKDFLFSARGVPMQGTGRATDGRYIKLVSERVGWHRNQRGHPDYLQDPKSASFTYSSEVKGAYGTVKENHSIAIDPDIIPRNSKVDIEAIGIRFADDNGHGIKDFHIDNFLGAGHEVVAIWLRDGVNGTKRRVKYMGGES